MSKEAVFTMKLDSQIVRELRRDFVQTQRQAQEYDDFLARKVAVARVSMRAGRGFSNGDVDAEFAARRASAMRHK